MFDILFMTIFNCIIVGFIFGIFWVTFQLTGPIGLIVLTIFCATAIAHAND